jgi:hypothetical protein
MATGRGVNRRRTIGCARVALAIVIVATALLVVACNTGGYRDLGTLAPVDPPAGLEGDWTLVEIAGAAWPPARVPARFVEISADGRTATVFFEGGRPTCNAVTGVDLERHDPGPPNATVQYGVRLGVWSCTADLWRLAVRVPLDPPILPVP